MSAATLRHPGRLPDVPPAPTDILTENAAIRLAGGSTVICEAERVSIALGDDATVIISDPGDGFGISGVWNNRSFHLRGPFVEDVRVRLFGHPPDSPHWRPAAQRDTRPIHLFTRLPEGCLYLGIGKPRQGDYRNGIMVGAKLTIDPALNIDVLDRVRPAGEPESLPDTAWLADVMISPTAALERVVAGWFPETVEDHGEVLSTRWNIPAPLEVFYRLARQHSTLLGRQNFIRLAVRPVASRPRGVGRPG